MEFVTDAWISFGVKFSFSGVKFSSGHTRFAQKTFFSFLNIVLFLVNFLGQIQGNGGK